MTTPVPSRPFGTFISRFNDLLGLGKLSPKSTDISLAEETLNTFERDIQSEPDKGLKRKYEAFIPLFREAIQMLRTQISLPGSAQNRQEITMNIREEIRQIERVQYHYKEKSGQLLAERQLQAEEARAEEEEAERVAEQARRAKEIRNRTVCADASLRAPVEALQFMDPQTESKSGAKYLAFSHPDSDHVSIRTHSSIAGAETPYFATGASEATAATAAEYWQMFNQMLQLGSDYVRLAANARKPRGKSSTKVLRRPSDKRELETSGQDDPPFNRHTMHWERLKDYTLGSGGFSSVCLGRYKPNPQHFEYKYMAVKIIAAKRGGMKSFEREVETLRRLDHPNIVQFFGKSFMFDGYIDSEEKMIVLLEYVPGGSLKQMIQAMNGEDSNQWIEEWACKVIVHQVLIGLEYLHGFEDGGVIHRDIKSENVLIDLKGIIKLTDFGTARYCKGMDENGGTKMVGTLEFLSFEVAGGKGVYTAKTDIWGVGCLIIEMLDGQRPYKSIGLESWAASMAAYSGRPPPAPVRASPETSALLREKIFVFEDRRLSAKEWLDESWLNEVRAPHGDGSAMDEIDE